MPRLKRDVDHVAQRVYSNDMEFKTVATVNNLPEIEDKSQKSSGPLLQQAEKYYTLDFTI